MFSTCKMHCLFLRKSLDESAKGWTCAQMHTHIHTHMDTDTGMCITMSMINCTYRGMPLTEAIHEYDSDMNQNEPFQNQNESFATGPKCMFIGRYHEIS